MSSASISKLIMTGFSSSPPEARLDKPSWTLSALTKIKERTQFQNSFLGAQSTAWAINGMGQLRFSKKSNSLNILVSMVKVVRPGADLVLVATLYLRGCTGSGQ